jgi:hypothetical protein
MAYTLCFTAGECLVQLFDWRTDRFTSSRAREALASNEARRLLLWPASGAEIIAWAPPLAIDDDGLAEFETRFFESADVWG